MALKDFKIGDIVWIKTPWLCNEFGNTDSIIKIEEISDNVCKYSFPIIEHFVRHYTGPETDTFEIDANTEATPQFTQDGFEKEMYKEYDKSQCVYGKGSTMPCMICSATCQARYKDFTEKGVKIVGIPVKANVPDSNGRVYSKEALAKAVKEYNEKNGTYKMYPPEVIYTNDAFDKAVEKEMLRIVKEQYGEPEEKVSLSTGLKDKWKSLKDDKGYKDFNDMVSKIHENIVSIDEEIKEQAHWLANNFSTRNGYTSMEENLIKMGEFVKNRMLDKYNLENE